ncbi:DUF3231 family protein [Halobacillus ihumii]|uniref:DUF3231 family protein n=1 Tax=Halobacillus ihumii TaxID=2686092 RepID=UPI001F072F07|nr:DUF3231 family protein [Halobacillus ihumii]
MSTKLTSSELASLWTSYMNDSMSNCILKYFLKHIEDEEIRPIVQFAYDLTTTHKKQLTTIFEMEEIPIPTSFTLENDVNLNAPRLFTDIFKLTYINHMAKVGLLAYSSYIAMSARKDVRNYFLTGLQEASELYDRSSDVSLSKGIFVRAPYMAYPQTTEFINSKKYLNGYSLFHKQRPLNAIEISHLFMNVQTNIIGHKLTIGFAQTSPRRDVQNWLFRGAEIAKKHVEVFAKTLLDNNIQAPASSDAGITNSTVPPFSDRLILFHMDLLSGAGIGNYATGAAASQRTDLFVEYERMSLEIAKYAKDGAELMIDHGWLEQPPGTLNKQQLARTKDTE